LDSQGVQVHQEGALARWSGAKNAPTYGRNPGAVAARGATADFIAAVLTAAVRGAKANSYAVPATLHQGVSVALTEAKTSANAYYSAMTAIAGLANWGDTSGRPELAAEVEKTAAERKRLEGDAGRAVAMHTTAMAESLGCMFAAEGGDWIRVMKSDQDAVAALKAMGEGLIVGVEVPAGPLARALVANLDPQHGGGIFGLGCQPTARAASTAAIEVVQKLGRPLPAGTRYVVCRMDPDAILAALVLSGRVPWQLLDMWEVNRLAILDDNAPAAAYTWVPGTRDAQTVGDDPTWGPLGSLCLSFTRGTLPLAELTTAAIEVALDTHASTATLVAARQEWSLSTEAISNHVNRIATIGTIAAASDMPIGPRTWVEVYARAPIGILEATNFPVAPGKKGRKFTVGVAREAGPHGANFTDAFRRRIESLESGWGGGIAITGSPFGRSSGLTLDQVVGVAAAAAAEVGFPGATPAPVRSPALPGLK
jgi:hypothetical protein